MTKKITNWKTWDKKNTFTLDQVAALFCNEDPLSEPSDKRGTIRKELVRKIKPYDCVAFGHHHFKPIPLDNTGRIFHLRTQIKNDCLFKRELFKEIAIGINPPPPFFSPEERVARAGEEEGKKKRIESPVAGRLTRQSKSIECVNVFGKLIKENPGATHVDLVALYRTGKYRDGTVFNIEDYAPKTLQKKIRLVDKRPPGRPPL